MSTLFQRSYKLTLDTVSIESVGSVPIDIRFKVSKTLKPEPNKCEITVWGLKQATRDALVKQYSTTSKTRKPVAVTLEGGYLNDRGVIFSGDLRDLTAPRERIERMVQIQGADGGHTYRTARINVAYGAGAAIYDALKACCDAMAIGEGNLSDYAQGASIGDLGSSFSHGVVLTGSAEKNLFRLLKDAGFTASIQNGVLQVQKQGQPLQTKAYRIAPDSGLIGSPTPEVDASALPSPTGKAKPSTSGLLNVKTLLIHQLYPGMKIDLESADYKGGYQITEVDYVGETRGQDWYCNLKVRPY